MATKEEEKEEGHVMVKEGEWAGKKEEVEDA